MLISGGLVSLVVALGLLNWSLAETPVDISPIPAMDGTAAGSKGATVTAQEETLPSSIASLGETVARPLFSPTRRPMVATPPAFAALSAATASAPSEASTPFSRLSLIGLMRVGDHSRALIRSEGNPQGAWTEVGHEIGGWRLSQIDDNRVLIEGVVTREELVLHAPPPQLGR